MLWAEGKAEWAALRDIPELAPVCVQGVAAKSKIAADELELWRAEMENAGAFEENKEVEVDISGIKRQRTDEENAPKEKSFVDDDGTLYSWDSTKRGYVPKATDMETYDESEMTFSAADEVIPILKKDGTVVDPKNKKVRNMDKIEEAMEREREKQVSKKEEKVEKEKEKAQWFDLKNNTSVYVSGFPNDVTITEIVEVFSKCGIVKEDAKGNPRVKIYRDRTTGDAKGDGLVTFLRLPSVDLAVNLMDDTAFRPEMSQKMSVSVAKFEQKGEEYVAKVESKKDKKQRLQKQEKGLGWGGFDDMVKRERCTVVLKHMFSLQEALNAGLGFAAELEQDIAEECCKVGQVVRLKVYAMHPDGICTILFKTPESADKCLELMHGRWFGGQQVVASLWDGRTNFHLEQVTETAADQEARLEKYAEELEYK
eukprot:CAMPEP_0196574302 /NCGR_PEP_ID=MMETSP1081-20130531/4048_1 /TAXON_ID=36882 /ORGANISM="Pyramimonas amylifera, Strain CCMP720" /LENGTH=425 /DNA_ID=CAMNT_0041892285 /DNA_START=237 /DNA_END=1514 /DNA_ORIENTATION=-